MARKIEKKVISDDLLFGDDFDEGKLARIEAELTRSPDSDALEEKQAKAKRAAKGGDQPASQAVPAPSSSEPGLDREALSQSPAATAPQDPSKQQRAALARVARSKMLFLAAVISVLAIITAGLVSLYWFKWRQDSLPPPQIVRHHIVIPSHRHVTSFFLLVNPSGKKKDLLKLDVEFDFSSLQAYEAFKGKQVLFSDIIYKYLRKQQSEDNSVEYWQRILEQDIFENLKRNYPETRLNAVEMKGFQRL